MPKEKQKNLTDPLCRAGQVFLFFFRLTGPGGPAGLNFAPWYSGFGS
jgi:hypothetical protein